MVEVFAIVRQDGRVPPAIFKHNVQRHATPPQATACQALACVLKDSSGLLARIVSALKIAGGMENASKVFVNATSCGLADLANSK